MIHSKKTELNLGFFFPSKLKQLSIFLDKEEKFESFHSPQTTLAIGNLFSVFKFLEIHFVPN